MKYKLTLLTDRMPMNEVEFRAWCEVMTEKLGWSTNFEELSSMAGDGPILIWESEDGTTTRVNVDIVQ